MGKAYFSTISDCELPACQSCSPCRGCRKRYWGREGGDGETVVVMETVRRSMGKWDSFVCYWRSRGQPKLSPPLPPWPNQASRAAAPVSYYKMAAKAPPSTRTHWTLYGRNNLSQWLMLDDFGFTCLPIVVGYFPEFSKSCKQNRIVHYFSFLHFCIDYQVLLSCVSGRWTWRVFYLVVFVLLRNCTFLTVNAKLLASKHQPANVT